MFVIYRKEYWMQGEWWCSSKRFIIQRGVFFAVLIECTVCSGRPCWYQVMLLWYVSRHAVSPLHYFICCAFIHDILMCYWSLKVFFSAQMSLYIQLVLLNSHESCVILVKIFKMADLNMFFNWSGRCSGHLHLGIQPFYSENRPTSTVLFSLHSSSDK